MVFNPLTYIKESKIELGKVIWPSRKETIRLTLVVSIASVIVGMYIAGLDALFATLADMFLYK